MGPKEDAGTTLSVSITGKCLDPVPDASEEIINTPQKSGARLIEFQPPYAIANLRRSLPPWSSLVPIDGRVCTRRIPITRVRETGRNEFLSNLFIYAPGGAGSPGDVKPRATREQHGQPHLPEAEPRAEIGAGMWGKSGFTSFETASPFAFVPVVSG